MKTERLTQAQLEAIQERVRLVTAGEWRRANYAVYGGNHGITVANAPTKNDAEFIAHSRQDIPALLAEVERMQRVLTEIASWPMGEYGARENHIIRMARESNGGDTE